MQCKNGDYLLKNKMYKLAESQGFNQGRVGPRIKSHIFVLLVTSFEKE